MAADLPQVIAATTGTSTERYIHGPRGLHAKQAANGDWTYALDDFLGSVRAWVDDDQQIVQMHSYDPYGHPTTPMTGFAFTGEPRDANGLQYHRARYYNPTLAGWLSLDPVQGDMGHPMSLNGYLYVNGNPVMNIDPTGMFSRTRSLTPGLGGGSRRTRRTRVTRTRVTRTRNPIRRARVSAVQPRSKNPLVCGVPVFVFGDPTPVPAPTPPTLPPTATEPPPPPTYFVPRNRPSLVDITCSLVGSGLANDVGFVVALGGGAEAVWDHQVEAVLAGYDEWIVELTTNPQYTNAEELAQIIGSKQALRLSPRWTQVLRTGVSELSSVMDGVTIAQAACQAGDGDWQGAGWTLLQLGIEAGAMSVHPALGLGVVIFFGANERLGLTHKFGQTAQEVGETMLGGFVQGFNPYNIYEELYERNLCRQLGVC